MSAIQAEGDPASEECEIRPFEAGPAATTGSAHNGLCCLPGAGVGGEDFVETRMRDEPV
jgi:hypothetical protein